MIDQIDFSQLRKLVTKQAEKFLAASRKMAPSETFYGLALVVDSDVTSFYCQANSEEALGHPGDRFFINDWKYNDDAVVDANDALSAIWKSFRAKTQKVSEDQADKLWRQCRKNCLESIVQGLQDFRKTDAIPKPVRESFALVVYDPDPNDGDETKDMARRLNSKKTYDAFVDVNNGFPYA